MAIFATINAKVVGCSTVIEVHKCTESVHQQQHTGTCEWVVLCLKLPCHIRHDRIPTEMLLLLLLGLVLWTELYVSVSKPEALV